MAISKSSCSTQRERWRFPPWTKCQDFSTHWHIRFARTLIEFRAHPLQSSPQSGFDRWGAGNASSQRAAGKRGVVQQCEGKEGQAHRALLTCRSPGASELCGTRVGCLLSVNSQWSYPITVIYFYSDMEQQKYSVKPQAHRTLFQQFVWFPLWGGKASQGCSHPACSVATPWAAQTPVINVKNIANVASLLLFSQFDLLAT